MRSWRRGPHAINCSTFRFPFCLFGLLLGWLVGGLVLFDERDTSITTSHKSSAGNPSICKPASNEIISDSVEQWDIDACFLHIQIMVTNVRLPKIHKIQLGG